MKHNQEEMLCSRLIDENTPFAIRESFNLLRTNLMYTITEDTSGCPIYAVTSTGENAGKSTIIVNLALAFTHISKRVLLIDGDMRCPVLHRFFQLESRHAGLSELISGIQNDVIVSNIRPGLDLITSGRIPPNPSELITSPRFTELLEQWKKEYDIIFIDFPPVDIVSDALAVCQNVTGYLFTVRSGKSNAKVVKNSIAQMEKVGAKITGIILNNHTMKGSQQHRYNRYLKTPDPQSAKSTANHAAKSSDPKETDKQ